MRQSLPEYYPFSKEEQEALWQRATIVVDTNVLLSLHRFTRSTRDELLRLLQAIAADGRLWAPHQVAEEYHRALPMVVVERQKDYQSLVDKASGLRGAFEAHLGPMPEDIGRPLDAMLRALRRAEKSHCSPAFDEKTTAAVTTLFDGRVGPRYNDDEMVARRKDADARFGQRRPPGFADAVKGDVRQYGDYLIWMQLLDYAEEQKRDIIFVTGDMKPDWWREAPDGQKVPHPELRREFANRVARSFYIFSNPDFLALAGKSVKVKLSQNALDEARVLGEAAAQEAAVKRHRELRRRQIELRGELERRTAEYEAACHLAETLVALHGEGEAFEQAARQAEFAKEEMTLVEQELRRANTEARRLRNRLGHDDYPKGRYETD